MGCPRHRHHDLGPHRRSPQPVEVDPLFAALATMIVVFRWEGIGGLLISGWLVFFAFVNHGVQINLVFGPMFLLGLLFLGCGADVIRGFRLSCYELVAQRLDKS